MKARYIASSVTEDLKEKMVFIGGPRQVGKTTLALSLLGRNHNEQSPAYLNWDVLADRESIIAGRLPAKQKRIVFDEIHKYAQWRNLMKGLFDKNKSSMSFVVTGSAKLDYYRKGGDSLQGRYHYYRLHPFSAGEISTNPDKATVEQLLRFGGFPEPLFKANDRFHRRWQSELSSRVVHEDLRDLENVREISNLDLLLNHLPECVGSPLSVNSLSRLLQAAPQTVEHWITIFERLYMCYRIPPFGGKKIRAVRKEKKLFFWDWSRVPESGPRFENMVAGHLLKYCNLREDTEGYFMELRYIRDTDRREVDFVVLRDGKPEFAVECKTGERKPAPACRYFRDRTAIPRFYQVHLGNRDFGNAESDTRVLPFAEFCRELCLP
jgi:predicted AAA+ superfamily ATPase